MSDQANRDNKGKLRWRNLPLFLFEDLIKVGEMGEKKYGTFNFLKGFPINDILDSAKRHLSKFENPYESDLDEESNQSHLLHAAWNLLVAHYTMKYMPEKDDRYKIKTNIDRKLSEINKIRQENWTEFNNATFIRPKLPDNLTENFIEFKNIETTSGLDKNRFLDFSNDKGLKGNKWK